MILKLNENINIKKVKASLKNQIQKGLCKNNYDFEINLIYKIIHEHSNYELYQWQLFGNDKEIVEQEIKSLLIDITSLDRKLAWDCISIFSRYQSLYEHRNEVNKKYFEGKS